MEVLKINIPPGFLVDKFDEETGEVSFKENPKNVMERIKTVDDILVDHGLTIEDIDKQFKDVPQHFKYQYIAELLCASLNEGAQPDWENINQAKCYPWFKMSSSDFQFVDHTGWLEVSTVSSRLCFKSREPAEYAGKQFTELYKKFMLI